MSATSRLPAARQRARSPRLAGAPRVRPSGRVVQRHPAGSGRSRSDRGGRAAGYPARAARTCGFSATNWRLVVLRSRIGQVVMQEIETFLRRERLCSDALSSVRPVGVQAETERTREGLRVPCAEALVPRALRAGDLERTGSSARGSSGRGLTSLGTRHPAALASGGSLSDPIDEEMLEDSSRLIDVVVRSDVSAWLDSRS